MNKPLIAAFAAVLLSGTAACTTSTSGTPSPSAPSKGSGSAADEYVALRAEQEIPRLLAQGMVNDGYAQEDVDVAKEGAEEVRDEIVQFGSGLEAIEFPSDVQDEVDAVLSLMREELAALDATQDATTLEEFDEAYQEWIDLPLEPYGDLRDALGVEDDTGLGVPDGTEVYSDDFSEEENDWEIFDVESAASRYASEAFELEVAPTSLGTAAPLDTHDFDRSSVLLSVYAEVIEGSDDESFSYGLSCPAENALDDGLHAELLGSGGYTFYRTSVTPDGLSDVDYYLFSPDPLDQYEEGQENRLDVRCAQVGDRVVVQLWVNGVYVDGTSFPYELPTGSADNGDGAVSAAVDPDAPEGAVVRFDNWSVSETEAVSVRR